MNRFLCLLRKDMALVFARPSTYALLAVFTLGAGALTFYPGRFFDANRADLATLFAFLPWLLVVLTSALAMDALSGERRIGTAELLYAMPLPAWQIILSKWLGLWVVCLIALWLTMSLWASISWLGQPDQGVIIAGYIGTAMMAGAYGALALAVSARTQSQVVAFLGALLINISISLGITPAFDFLPPMISRALADFSMPAHMMQFVRGVIRLEDVFFFISLTIFGLYGAVIAWRKASWILLRLVLSLLVLLGLNGVAGSGLWRPFALDMTAQHLYTLNPAVSSILDEKSDVSHWSFYYSRKLAAQYPDIRFYGAQVGQTLQRFTDAGKGKIILRQIDPGHDTPKEDAALAAGMQATPTDEGLPLYFGLADEKGALIARFDPSRASLLEYDLARALDHKAASKIRIALYDGIDLAGRNWYVSGRKKSYLYTQLEQEFQVDLLGDNFSAETLDGHILMLVHPPQFGREQAQVLSDFIATGGRALIFLDPYSEASARPGLNGLPLGDARMTSTAPGFLLALNLGWTSTKILLDREAAMPAQRQQDGQTRTLRQPAWLGITPDHFASGNPVTAPLSRGLVMASAAAIKPARKDQWQALILSSTNTALMKASAFALDPDPNVLMSTPASDQKQYWLAAMREGVIIFGDADFLDDDFYVLDDPVFGPKARTDNAEMVLNALRLLGGNSHLSLLNAKREPVRTLRKIDDMRSRAEQKLRDADSALSTLPPDDAKARLRTIRQQFHHRISRIEAGLELINIWLMPSLVVLFGGFFVLWRRRRRSHH